MSDVPSQADITRVRRYECRMSGHTTSSITELGSLAPKLVVCSNCGGEWRIHPDDVDKDFGRE